MRKKRFIYTLAAVLLMCSAAGVGAGCGKSSPALLDSFGTHLDTLMTSKDKLSKMDGAAADLCVIERNGCKWITDRLADLLQRVEKKKD